MSDISITKQNEKYEEIVHWHPVEVAELNTIEVAQYMCELEFNFAPKNCSADTYSTLRNINFIVACYIWYYIRDDEENWTFVEAFDEQESKDMQQCFKHCYYDYKSARFFQQQAGLAPALHRVPQAARIGSIIGVGSSIGAVSLCISGTVALVSANLEHTMRVCSCVTQHAKAKALLQMSTIPLSLCASVIIGALVGGCTLLAVPCVTVGSVGLYLANGTDLTDMESWQYIGATKLNMTIPTDHDTDAVST